VIEVSKQDKKDTKAKEGVCPYCGYDCRDKESLERHVDWSHKEKKEEGK